MKPLVPVSEVLQGFEYVLSDLPPEMLIDKNGVLSDDEALYLFRRSINPDQQIGERPLQLYNGSAAGRRFNATEGHGLYTANRPDAMSVPGIKGNAKYCLRVPLQDTVIFDATERLHSDQGYKKASRLHGMRSVFPGVPNLGTPVWDKWYGDADVVLFRPMLVARFAIGLSAGSDSQPYRSKPTWALLRSPEQATIVAKSVTS